MALFLFVAILLSAADTLWAIEICCGDLGCYDDSWPYNDMPLPQCPEDMGIIMKLYTRQNPTTGETITKNTIPLVFKGGANTTFVTHGWQQIYFIPWMEGIKDAILAQGDYNVITVDWTVGARDLLYFQPVSNTRTVGGEIALVIKTIISNGLSKKESMRCVGHSLGAHVCGQAGQGVKFGRITGLDPAGPLFDNRDPSAGLNPSCADLVDVIHTDGPTLINPIGAGTMRTLGHIDFYPNGGNRQPGCIISPGATPLEDFYRGDISGGCNHNRAITLYTESIKKPCFLSRYSCSDQANLPESCTESRDAVQSMGYYADAYPGRGIFYLKTNSATPFCRE